MAHKILIVDDDKINIALIKFGLAEKQYEVFEACDGLDGLAKIKTLPVDLIVLDVHMPNMSGFEFMTELKSLDEHKSTPVIMLTANETMEDIFKLEGVKGYFIKPVVIGDLIAKIIECLGSNNI